jgi:hypothetical protein
LRKTQFDPIITHAFFLVVCCGMGMKKRTKKCVVMFMRF